MITILKIIGFASAWAVLAVLVGVIIGRAARL